MVAIFHSMCFLHLLACILAGPVPKRAEEVPHLLTWTSKYIYEQNHLCIHISINHKCGYVLVLFSLHSSCVFLFLLPFLFDYIDCYLYFSTVV